MRPDKVSIPRLFEDRQQYLIPLFQRGYVWTLAGQILPLWEDIIDRVDALDQFQRDAQRVGGVHKLRPLRKHFLGTVVVGSQRGGSAQNVPSREVIDGQQRITTLQILLLALRDVTGPLQDEALEADLKQCTRNMGRYVHAGHHLKVWPTNAGRDVMQSLAELGSLAAVCERYPVRGPKRQVFERPLLVQAYLFFYAMLSGHLRGIRWDDALSTLAASAATAPGAALPGGLPLADELAQAAADVLGMPAEAVAADLPAVLAGLGASVPAAALAQPQPEPEPEDDEPTVAHRVLTSIERDNALWLPAPERALQPARAELLWQALREALQIMVLELEDEDDPQIIFETLNARGAPLQPSDLIRNFIFLQSTRKGEDVDALYEAHWKPFDEALDDQAHKKGAERFWRKEARQGRLTSVRLDLLLYHYVTLRKRSELKVAHVFDEFKRYWDEEVTDTATELARLQTLARHFEVFLVPHQHSRLGLFCRRMQLLDTATLIPLVFHFLEHHAPDSPALTQVLDDLESYVVRRWVCGFSAKGYNRVFTGRLLAELVEAGSADPQALRQRLAALSGESQCWPSDAQFEQAWLHRSLYQGRNTGKVRAVLETLELASRSSRQEALPLPDGLTVEHVLPQKWQTHWPWPDATVAQCATRERLLHSIGNLTLVTQAFNASLGNAAFADKQPEIVQTSLLQLNVYFQTLGAQATWDEAAILARAQVLYPLARRVWHRP